LTDGVSDVRLLKTSLFVRNSAMKMRQLYSQQTMMVVMAMRRRTMMMMMMMLLLLLSQMQYSSYGLRGVVILFV
jgi:hypothetical protein